MMPIQKETLTCGGKYVARNSVGIDIGSSSVRAVEIVKKGKSFKVVRAAEVELPRGVVVAGEVRDTDTLALAVKQLWKEGKFKSKNVSFGLGGPQTLVRQVDLPWEPGDVFRESLPLRISADLPVDPEEMTLDYHPLEVFTNSADAQIQRALVVASVNIIAENIADSLVAAGLKIKRADFMPFALIRVAKLTAGDGSPVPEAQQPGEEWDCEVIVDIGGQNTTIAIHHQGRPLFVRIVSAGTEAITRALGDNIQVTFEVAEKLRRTLGIGSISNDEMISDPDLVDITPAQINAAQYITNAMAGSLVQVVRESVEYYLSASPNITGVSRVLLSGGGATLPGYAERVASELRAPTSILAPMHGYAAKSAEDEVDLDPRLCMAIGLALEVD